MCSSQGWERHDILLFSRVFFAFGVVGFFFKLWHTIAYMGGGMAQMRSKGDKWLPFYLER